MKESVFLPPRWRAEPGTGAGGGSDLLRGELLPDGWRRLGGRSRRRALRALRGRGKAGAGRVSPHGRGRPVGAGGAGAVGGCHAQVSARRARDERTGTTG